MIICKSPMAIITHFQPYFARKQFKMSTTLIIWLLATTVVSVPSTVDWRSDFNPIGNSGICNSSWAFAATSLYQAQISIQTGQHVDLSEEYVLQCSFQGSCTGGSIAGAMIWLGTHGAPLASDYPYLAENMTSGRPETDGICEAKRIGLPHQLVVHEQTKISTHRLKKLVAKRPTGNLICAINDFKYWSLRERLECNYRAHNRTGTLNHSVAVVGYNKNRDFLLRNSQGTGWGDNGYIFIKKNHDCGLRERVFQFRNASATVLAVGMAIGISLIL